MGGVCPHVHLSHISGHFPSNISFLDISGHFRSIFGKISRQMHYSRASQCIFVQYGKYIYGIFFRISNGGICVIERGLWYEEKDMSEGREDYGMGGVQHRVSPGSV